MKKVLSIVLSLCMLLSITAGLDFSSYAKDEINITSISASNLPKSVPQGFLVNPKGIKVKITYSDKSTENITLNNNYKWVVGDSVEACVPLKKTDKIKLCVELPGFAGGYDDSDDGNYSFISFCPVDKKGDYISDPYVRKSYKVKAPENPVKSCTIYNATRYAKNQYVVLNYSSSKGEVVTPSNLICSSCEDWAVYKSEKTENRNYIYETSKGLLICYSIIKFADNKAYKNGKYASNAKVKKCEPYCMAVYDTKNKNVSETTIKKLSSISKGFNITWKKVTTNVNGYQIQYAKDSEFKKNSKKVSVNKNSTTAKKITGLKAKTKYYVRIRSYKTIKINGETKKIYSGWSKVKTVKTK